MLGGTKDIMSPPVQKLGGHVTRSPHKLGPCLGDSQKQTHKNFVKSYESPVNFKHFPEFKL